MVKRAQTGRGDHSTRSKRALPPITPNITEKHLEQACTDFMVLDGWRPLKTDPVSRREWGKGFGEKGMADHLYLRPMSTEIVRLTEIVGLKPRAQAARCDVLWVEFKRPKGGRLAQDQLDWHFQQRLLGFMTWHAMLDFEPTIEGYIQHYLASGLLRNQGLRLKRSA